MTQLQTARFKLTEHENNDWTVYPEKDTPLEAILEPGYWAHISAKLRPFDEIRVIAEDGSFYARLLVQDAGRLYAKVAKIEYVELNKVDVEQASGAIAGYKIKWRGPHEKWSVLRGEDVLVSGKTKDAANLWLVEHLKTIAA